ncbi:MAG: Uncharacterized protein G01um101493_108 [Microgenomates group bacterium Gr01-1014_93]|nr:MAG: Uncharacterized protein G01um101493_108 [Microgenomates group bacterium Gr01-1014_93]
MFFTVIIFIITLLILVVIHELGHFLMAKKFNIKVLEFGFGIPPRAWGKKIGETLVSINWLPFGGFVRLLGEDEVDKAILGNKRSFVSQTVSKRITVVIAGVFMNLILAWILFYIILGTQNFKTSFPLILDHKFVGVTQVDEALVLIRGISKDSPAEAAGIKPGGSVLSINGEKIEGTFELSEKIKAAEGKEVTLLLKNPETDLEQEIKVTPRENPPPGQGAIGVSLTDFHIAKIEYKDPLSKIFAGPIHSWNLTAYSGKIFGSLLARSIQTKNIEPVSQTVSGPVGITNVVNSILTESKKPILEYLNFVALLSLNLAVLNVLPFPALDGGRLSFLFIEAITRKKVKAEVEKWVHTIGMAILLTLMLLVTFSDIKKLIP